MESPHSDQPGTPQPQALIGTVVDGRYEVRSMLAKGGMATVYVATDLRLDRTIALKVMHPHLAHDQAFVSRFQREARSAARLSHGHVVAVYDQGSDDGLVYLAMEYVPGRTLRDVMRSYGPLTPEQALVFLDPVLEALAAAHAAGFVHRDIKPENVLISNDGRVKVADFGLARAVEPDGHSVTHGMIIGTVAYLSPEQVERGEADGRSDVYAAGILMFEMITGQVPHAGESPLSVAYQHVNSDVPAPSSIRAGIAPEVDALVITSTRRDPALRYQNALDFLADVRQVRTALPAPRPFVDERDTLIVDATMTSRLTDPHGAARSTASPRAAQKSAPASPAAKERALRTSGQPASPEAPRYRRSKAPWVVVGIIIAVLVAGIGGWYVAAGPGKSVALPDLVGASVEEAQRALAGVELTLDASDEQFSETVPKGDIIATDPAAGEDARVGSTVAATVSLGPERYEVPALKGLDIDEATKSLAAANLALGQTRLEYDTKVNAGNVVSSSPKAGTQSKRGTVVDVVISKGPEPVPVPDVEGRKASAAKASLSRLELKADVTTKFSEKVPDGVVIAIRPAAGTVVEAGSRVSLVVSKGPPPVTVPSLIDMPRDKAIATLQGLGLKAKVVEGDFSPLNRVISQDPAAGTSIPRGSTVTIRII